MSEESWQILFCFIFLSLFSLCGSFLIRKKNKLPFKVASRCLLALGSVFFLLGVLEPVLFVIETHPKLNKKFPDAPYFLSTYRANSYTLINNSILYIAPPSHIPPFFGHFRTFGYQFQTNQLGFREKNFSLKKDEKKFRIVVFGDSFTFGVGVHDSHRYTNVLEAMLNRMAHRERFEVLNFGMPGYAADQEHELMRAILKFVECDLVVIGFCCDDLIRTNRNILKSYTTNNPLIKPLPLTLHINGKYFEVFSNPQRNFDNIPENEPKEFSSKSPWYKNTRLYKFLAERTNININAKLPHEGQWEYSLNEFKGMKRLAQSYGLPAPVIVLLNYGSVDPDKNNFKNPSGNLAQRIQLYNYVGKKLKDEEFHVVDTLPLFEKYSGMSMATSEWEFHPNYLGHYIYAKSIMDYLIMNKIIDLKNMALPNTK